MSTTNARRARRRGQPDRFAELTLCEMVAVDTIVPIAGRIETMFSHGRRITAVRRFVYSDGTTSDLELKAGLTLAEPPLLQAHDRGQITFDVRLGTSTLDWFGLVAALGDGETAHDVWQRHSRGNDARRNMTQVELTGGLPAAGPARGDQLTVRNWNSHGVCREIQFVFDHGTGPCELAPLRTQLDQFMAGLRDMQPWDVRKMLEELQEGLRTHLAHTPTGGEALLALVRAYGDQREAVAGAQAVAGPQEEAEHRAAADRLLDQISGKVTGHSTEPARCAICSGTDRVRPDEDGTPACQPCHDTRLSDDAGAG